MDGVPRVPKQWHPGSEEPAALRFSVLGPVRAWLGDDPLPAGSPQQRALLAALLLRDGRTATASELIDALWGDEPPPRRWPPCGRTPPGCARRSAPRCW